MTKDEYFTAVAERGWTGAAEAVIEFIALGIVAWSPLYPDRPNSGYLKVVNLLSEFGHEDTAFVEVLRRIDADEWAELTPHTSLEDLSKWNHWPPRDEG